MNYPIETTKQIPLIPIPYSFADEVVLRSGIKFLSYNVLSIPTPIVQKYFPLYKLHYWSGSYIIQQIQAGMIERHGVAFIVQYYDGLTRGYILANPDEQYKLSFRSGLMNDPVVLISIVE
jgi:hypothetical protein